jgi:hypothetical protein
MEEPPVDTPRENLDLGSSLKIQQMAAALPAIRCREEAYLTFFL